MARQQASLSAYAAGAAPAFAPLEWVVLRHAATAPAAAALIAGGDDALVAALPSALASALGAAIPPARAAAARGMLLASRRERGGAQPGADVALHCAWREAWAAADAGSDDDALPGWLGALRALVVRTVREAGAFDAAAAVVHALPACGAGASAGGDGAAFVWQVRGAGGVEQAFELPVTQSDMVAWVHTTGAAIDEQTGNLLAAASFFHAAAARMPLPQLQLLVAHAGAAEAVARHSWTHPAGEEAALSLADWLGATQAHRASLLASVARGGDDGVSEAWVSVLRRGVLPLAAAEAACSGSDGGGSIMDAVAGVLLEAIDGAPPPGAGVSIGDAGRAHDQCLTALRALATLAHEAGAVTAGSWQAAPFLHTTALRCLSACRWAAHDRSAGRLVADIVALARGAGGDDAAAMASLAAAAAACAVATAAAAWSLPLWRLAGNPAALDAAPSGLPALVGGSTINSVADVLAGHAAGTLVPACAAILAAGGVRVHVLRRGVALAALHAPPGGGGGGTPVPPPPPGITAAATALGDDGGGRTGSSIRGHVRHLRDAAAAAGAAVMTGARTAARAVSTSVAPGLTAAMRQHRSAASPAGAVRAASGSDAPWMVAPSLDDVTHAWEAALALHDALCRLPGAPPTAPVAIAGVSAALAALLPLSPDRPVGGVPHAVAAALISDVAGDGGGSGVVSLQMTSASHLDVDTAAAAAAVVEQACRLQTPGVAAAATEALVRHLHATLLASPPSLTSFAAWAPYRRLLVAVSADALLPHGSPSVALVAALQRTAAVATATRLLCRALMTSRMTALEAARSGGGGAHHRHRGATVDAEIDRLAAAVRAQLPQLAAVVTAATAAVVGGGATAGDDAAGSVLQSLVAAIAVIGPDALASCLGDDGRNRSEEEEDGDADGGSAAAATAAVVLGSLPTAASATDDALTYALLLGIPPPTSDDLTPRHAAALPAPVVGSGTPSRSRRGAPHTPHGVAGRPSLLASAWHAVATARTVLAATTPAAAQPARGLWRHGGGGGGEDDTDDAPVAARVDSVHAAAAAFLDAAAYGSAPPPRVPARSSGGGSATINATVTVAAALADAASWERAEGSEGDDGEVPRDPRVLLAALVALVGGDSHSVARRLREAQLRAALADCGSTAASRRLAIAAIVAARSGGAGSSGGHDDGGLRALAVQLALVAAPPAPQSSRSSDGGESGSEGADDADGDTGDDDASVRAFLASYALAHASAAPPLSAATVAALTAVWRSGTMAPAALDGSGHDSAGDDGDVLLRAAHLAAWFAARVRTPGSGGGRSGGDGGVRPAPLAAAAVWMTHDHDAAAQVWQPAARALATVHDGDAWREVAVRVADAVAALLRAGAPTAAAASAAAAGLSDALVATTLSDLPAAVCTWHGVTAGGALTAPPLVAFAVRVAVAQQVEAVAVGVAARLLEAACCDVLAAVRSDAGDERSSFWVTEVAGAAEAAAVAAATRGGIGPLTLLRLLASPPSLLHACPACGAALPDGHDAVVGRDDARSVVAAALGGLVSAAAAGGDVAFLAHTSPPDMLPVLAASAAADWHPAAAAALQATAVQLSLRADVARRPHLVAFVAGVASAFEGGGASATLAAALTTLRAHAASASLPATAAEAFVAADLLRHGGSGGGGGAAAVPYTLRLHAGAAVLPLATLPAPPPVAAWYAAATVEAAVATVLGDELASALADGGEVSPADTAGVARRLKAVGDVLPQVNAARDAAAAALWPAAAGAGGAVPVERRDVLPAVLAVLASGAPPGDTDAWVLAAPPLLVKCKSPALLRLHAHVSTAVAAACAAAGTAAASASWHLAVGDGGVAVEVRPPPAVASGTHTTPASLRAAAVVTLDLLRGLTRDGAAGLAPAAAWLAVECAVADVWAAAHHLAAGGAGGVAVAASWPQRFVAAVGGALAAGDAGTAGWWAGLLRAGVPAACGAGHDAPTDDGAAAASPAADGGAGEEAAVGGRIARAANAFLRDVVVAAADAWLAHSASPDVAATSALHPAPIALTAAAVRCAAAAKLLAAAPPGDGTALVAAAARTVRSLDGVLDDAAAHVADGAEVEAVRGAWATMFKRLALDATPGNASVVGGRMAHVLLSLLAAAAAAEGNIPLPVFAADIDERLAAAAPGSGTSPTLPLALVAAVLPLARRLAVDTTAAARLLAAPGAALGSASDAERAGVAAAMSAALARWLLAFALLPPGAAGAAWRAVAAAALHRLPSAAAAAWDARLTAGGSPPPDAAGWPWRHGIDSAIPSPAALASPAGRGAWFEAALRDDVPSGDSRPPTGVLSALSNLWAGAASEGGARGGASAGGTCIHDALAVVARAAWLLPLGAAWDRRAASTLPPTSSQRREGLPLTARLWPVLEAARVAVGGNDEELLTGVEVVSEAWVAGRTTIARTLLSGSDLPSMGDGGGGGGEDASWESAPATRAASEVAAVLLDGAVYLCQLVCAPPSSAGAASTPAAAAPAAAAAVYAGAVALLHDATAVARFAAGGEWALPSSAAAGDDAATTAAAAAAVATALVAAGPAAPSEGTGNVARLSAADVQALVAELATAVRDVLPPPGAPLPPAARAARVGVARALVHWLLAASASAPGGDPSPLPPPAWHAVASYCANAAVGATLPASQLLAPGAWRALAALQPGRLVASCLTAPLIARGASLRTAVVESHDRWLMEVGYLAASSWRAALASGLAHRGSGGGSSGGGEATAAALAASLPVLVAALAYCRLLTTAAALLQCAGEAGPDDDTLALPAGYAVALLPDVALVIARTWRAACVVKRYLRGALAALAPSAPTAAASDGGALGTLTTLLGRAARAAASVAGGTAAGAAAPSGSSSELEREGGVLQRHLVGALATVDGVLSAIQGDIVADAFADVEVAVAPPLPGAVVDLAAVADAAAAAAAAAASGSSATTSDDEEGENGEEDSRLGRGLFGAPAGPVSSGLSWLARGVLDIVASRVGGAVAGASRDDEDAEEGDGDDVVPAAAMARTMPSPPQEDGGDSDADGSGSEGGGAELQHGGGSAAPPVQQASSGWDDDWPSDGSSPEPDAPRQEAAPAPAAPVPVPAAEEGGEELAACDIQVGEVEAVVPVPGWSSASRPAR